MLQYNTRLSELRRAASELRERANSMASIHGGSSSIGIGSRSSLAATVDEISYIEPMLDQLFLMRDRQQQRKKKKEQQLLNMNMGGSRPGQQSQSSSQQKYGDYGTMTVVYRIRGLNGEATENELKELNDNIDGSSGGGVLATEPIDKHILNSVKYACLSVLSESGGGWNHIGSRHSRNIARNTSRIRPTFSRSSDLGILGPLCVGLQREMASCLSRTSPGARTRSAACSRYKFRRGLDCLRGLDDGCKPRSGRRPHHGGVLATIARTHRASCEGQRSAHELSSLRSFSLHLGFGGGRTWNLGGLSSELARYLGSVATRINRRLSSHNGICNRTACVTSLLRDAPSVQHQAHVCSDPVPRHRMSAARQFRNSRLSRLGYDRRGRGFLFLLSPK